MIKIKIKFIKKKKMITPEKSQNSGKNTLNYAINKILKKIKIIINNLSSLEGKLKKLLILSLITLTYL